MTRILLLPLDERPCNYQFPRMMAEGCDAVQLVMPPLSILGKKKEAANGTAVDDWLKENFSTCDYAVISFDMLVYGGIVPARLHHLTPEQCLARLALIEELHAACPQVKIYAFNLIMRAPAYDSSEEEPDYYAQYGRRLWRLGVLRDKIAREMIVDAEKNEMETLERELPEEVVRDFCGRRAVNQCVNVHAIEMLQKGILDFLVVPLDDCAAYGWAPSEQQKLRVRIAQAGLSGRAHMYSGADEVGSVLLARAVNNSRSRTPAVYLQYSGVYAPFLIPKYEDRPLGENLKWQIATAGGRICASPELADFVLMVNAPTAGGERMAEAGMNFADLDASYSNCRCLPEFVASMRAFMADRPVVLADIAAANGGDPELLSMLAQEGLLPRLASYAAWNTAANAAGTCIAHAMICLEDFSKGARFVTHRLLEDWAYMADVRQRAWKLALENGGDYFNLSGQEEALAGFVQKGLEEYLDRYAMPQQVCVKKIEFPWHRLFEIDLSIL